MSNLKEYSKILKKGHFRYDKQAYDAFALIAEGKVNTDDIKDFLLAINQRGVNTRLLFGAAKVLSERLIRLKAPEDAIDVCGTGGDKLNTLNVSTAVSFVVAASGVPVAKHGNKAVSSLSGSADIFNELGIDINQEKEKIEESLFDNNIAFIFAPLYHPALKHVAQARKELGVKTIFNYLGPLLNPANAKYQLIGCPDSDIAKVMIETAGKLDKSRCWVVCGMDGMDEITITDKSKLFKMDEEVIYDSEVFDPLKYNISKFTLDDLRGKDVKYNAQRLIELLKGKRDNKQLEAYYNIVVANSAAALIIAKKADNFDDAIAIARDSIKSGNAFNILKKISNL